MDLKISYNWLREYVDTKLSAQDLARELSLHSFNVERIHKENESLDKVVVGRVMKTGKHPNADKLSLNDVDLGGGKMVKIVCGAPNVYEGMVCAVALPGAKVKWHGEGDLVELKATAIRGQESFGMICAASEIGLAELFPEQDKGVLDFKGHDLKIGESLAKALQLDDYVYDMEITSNRPDVLGIVGLAREAAVVGKGKFLYKEAPLPKHGKEKLPLKIELTEKKACLKYTAVVLSGVKLGSSPWWLQKRLRQAGIRPINNIVDITNCVMTEHGKPMHAFDYDKLSGQQINIRFAKPGETLQAMDGKTYNFKKSHLIMADANGPIEIAGLMGGNSSGIGQETTRIVLLSATFDPLMIRRAARDLNLHSDASSRFEKGLHPMSCLPTLKRGIELAQDLAGAKLASQVFDLGEKNYRPAKIKLETQTVSDQMGVTLAPAQIKKILSSLGFNVTGSAKTLTVTVPWWRAGDVAMDRDLVEEVARIYGYHNLPSQLPEGKLSAALPDPQLKWESEIKRQLAAVGPTEIYSYSFISEKMLAGFGLKPDSTLKLHNPLNEEMVYMRPTLLPSLLQVVAQNEGFYPEQSLFELANVYLSAGMANLPDETPRLAGALTGKDWSALFYRGKGVLEYLFVQLGLKLDQVKWQESKADCWIKNRSADIFYGEQQLGSMGFFRPEVLHSAKVKSTCLVWELDAKLLSSKANDLKSYAALPKFPSVKLDLALVVKQNATWAQVAGLVKEVGQTYIESIEVFDVYQGKGVPEDSKSLAFHITYRDPQKTLSMEEVQQLHQKIVKNLQTKLGAQVRA
ncbi:phenylalanine--tRNA ligase subunit beta [Candidatus Uhrbacteria bacterium]|nr:phenylalanine--tRNA ligase subunit beta [Candidatus Uhrbacteria bacterium]